MNTAAATILQQLGNSKFIAMTGAKNFMSSNGGNTLMFRLPSNFASKGINAINITLDASDTYTMKCCKVRGTTVKEISTLSGIYNDQLQSVFTSTTGLDTHL